MSCEEKIHDFVNRNRNFIVLPLVQEIVDEESPENSDDESSESVSYEVTDEYVYYYLPKIEELFEEMISSTDGFVIGTHEKFGTYITNPGSEELPFFLHDNQKLERLLFRIIQNYHENTITSKIKLV